MGLAVVADQVLTLTTRDALAMPQLDLQVVKQCVEGYSASIVVVEGFVVDTRHNIEAARPVVLVSRL
jgi:hypothetical protein